MSANSEPTSPPPRFVRLLVFSTLYPNAEQARHGIFVETRLRQLLRTGRVSATVVAPVPWFPSTHPLFGTYARYARVPPREQRHGLSVHHPRFPVVPKVGMSLAPALLAVAALRAVRRLVRDGLTFDLIDAHFFYPDGVAAVILGRLLGVPVVVTARGSDINLYPEYALPRRWIRWAARHAAHLVTVSQALKRRLVSLGVGEDRVTVLRNGVDTDLFRPVDRAEARGRLGLDGFTLLAVGNLVPEKGHDLLLRALPDLPDLRLLIVGDGPGEGALRALAAELGVAARVTFLPVIAQPQLPEVYTAADLLVLASTREGWPNVLLEAMACGTPVVAVGVGGVPEIVGAGSGGVVVGERSVPALVAAIRELRRAVPARDAVRAYARGFSWQSTSDGLLELFAGLVRPPARPADAAELSP